MGGLIRVFLWRIERLCLDGTIFLFLFSSLGKKKLIIATITLTSIAWKKKKKNCQGRFAILVRTKKKF